MKNIIIRVIAGQVHEVYTDIDGEILVGIIDEDVVENWMSDDEQVKARQELKDMEKEIKDGLVREIWPLYEKEKNG